MSPPHTADDKSLTRIAALLRKAESTDNEHEADAYLQAAQRLATAASVDLAVARAHTAAGERRDMPSQREVVVGEPGKRGLRTYVELFVAIARANDVTCDVARNSTRVFAYGFESDLDTAHALYASLIVQMVRASDEFIKSGAYAAEAVRRYSARSRRWELRPVSPITARLSFQRAYAARIGRRLSDARKAALAEALRADAAAAKQAQRQARRMPQSGAADAPGSGMTPQPTTHATSAEAPGVVLALRAKELELVEHYQAHSTARGRWQGSAASAGHSEHASRAGDAAGRRARLGTERAIGGARTAIRG